MSKFTQPLNNAQIADISKTIQDLKDLRGQYDKYVACGVDCDEKMQMIDYLTEQLQTIIDVWVHQKVPPTNRPSSITGSS